MMNKKLNGFSLIELSIVILVISTIAASSLTIFSKKNLADKNRETRAKLERIAEAVKIFYGRHIYIPCPALPDLPVDDVNFGLTSDAPGGNCSSIPGISTSAASTLVSGAVPIATLGLPPQYMFDSWGNRIVYIVDQRYNTANALLLHLPSDGIRIQHRTGELITKRRPYRTGVSGLGTVFTDCRGININPVGPNSDISDCPVLLLMSHGSNGLHSYDAGGGGPKQATFGINAPELQNVTVTHPVGTLGVFIFDEIFVDAEINQDMKDFNFTNYFDDILFYKPKSYFIGLNP